MAALSVGLEWFHCIWVCVCENSPFNKVCCFLNIRSTKCVVFLDRHSFCVVFVTLSLSDPIPCSLPCLWSDRQHFEPQLLECAVFGQLGIKQPYKITFCKSAILLMVSGQTRGGSVCVEMCVTITFISLDTHFATLSVEFVVWACW